MCPMMTPPAKPTRRSSPHAMAARRGWTAPAAQTAAITAASARKTPPSSRCTRGPSLSPIRPRALEPKSRAAGITAPNMTAAPAATTAAWAKAIPPRSSQSPKAREEVPDGAGDREWEETDADQMHGEKQPGCVDFDPCERRGSEDGGDGRRKPSGEREQQRRRDERSGTRPAGRRQGQRSEPPPRPVSSAYDLRPPAGDGSKSSATHGSSPTTHAS